MDALKDYNDSDMDLDENSEQTAKKSGNQVGQPRGCKLLFFLHRCILNNEHLCKAFRLVDGIYKLLFI